MYYAWKMEGGCCAPSSIKHSTAPYRHPVCSGRSYCLSSSTRTVLSVSNPYDFCVVNKMVNGKQFTIVWYYVNDLKLSHIDSSVVDGMIETIKREFGKELDVTVRRGKVHDYLGIHFDFSEDGKVIMTMNDYIEELLLQGSTR